MQHIVFSVKFLIAAFIPDIPADVRLAIKRVRLSRLYSTYFSSTLNVFLLLHITQLPNASDPLNS